VQLFKTAGKFVIKLIKREHQALDEVIDLAETVSVQSHKAAEAAKEVLAAVQKLKAALAEDEAEASKSEEPKPAAA
jgi:hypothetical protein